MDVLLPDDGFMAFLKQMTASPVSAVKPYHIAGQQSLHDGCHWRIAGLQQQVEVIMMQRTRGVYPLVIGQWSLVIKGFSLSQTLPMSELINRCMKGATVNTQKNG
jgi:hypothetical protein